MANRRLALGHFLTNISLRSVGTIFLILMVTLIAAAILALQWQKAYHQDHTSPAINIHQPAILLCSEIQPRLVRLRDLISLLDDDVALNNNQSFSAMLQSAITNVEQDLTKIDMLSNQIDPPNPYLDLSQRALTQVEGLRRALPSLLESQKIVLAHDLLKPLQRLRLTVDQLQRLHRRAFDTLLSNEGDSWLDLEETPLWGIAGLLLLCFAAGIRLTLYLDSVNQKHLKTEQLALENKLQIDYAKRIHNHLLTNMSHEIRTPLNTVLGMVDVLRDARLTKEQQNYLTLTQAAGDNLLALVSNLSDMARIESGKFYLDDIPFDLTSLVDHIGKMMELRLMGDQVTVQYQISDTMPHRLIGDPRRLSQILFHLTSNSIKYTKKGKVLLTVSPCPPPTLADSTSVPDKNLLWYSFLVKDTGIGIPTERINLITSELNKTEQVSTLRSEGAGIGLFLCKQLTQLMGGNLKIESKEGVGSTFSVTLPFRQQNDTMDLLKRLRILIIHRPGEQKQRLLELINGMGCLNTLVAENGKQGLALLRDTGSSGSAVGIVILECGVNNMEWMRVGNEIRLISPTMPLILVSYGQFSPDIIRQAAINTNGTLLPPITQDSLKKTLTAALSYDAVVYHSPHSQSATVERGTTERPWRILTVDDSEDSILLMQTYLRDKHFRVDAAANGSAALDKLRFNQYDLIFMDLQMPVMDGLEATRRLRKWEKERQVDETPVVALTAHTWESDEQQAIAAGCTIYLTKPIRKLELLKVVETICKR